MFQKIKCQDGKCREVRSVDSFVERNDFVGLIEKDLLKNELGVLYGNE